MLCSHGWASDQSHIIRNIFTFHLYYRNWEELDILRWMVKWGFPECLSNLTIDLPRISLTTCRGVQYMYCMMHKCIMVKIGGKKNTQIRSKTHKRTKTEGNLMAYTVVLTKNQGIYITGKESILQEWLLVAKLCTDFTLKHRWRPKIKKCFYIKYGVLNLRRQFFASLI